MPKWSFNCKIETRIVMLVSKHKTFFIINLCLLVSGLVMSISGLVILINYHMGHEGRIITTDKFWSLDYFDWSLFHKIAVIFFTLLTLFHITLHWKWYKIIIRKRLLKKNLQVITLSVLFILVATTGFIPWLMQLCGAEESLRKAFLEIHDKLGLLLFVYLTLHIIKRANWFVNNH